MDHNEQAPSGSRDLGAGDPALAVLSAMPHFDRYRHHVAHLNMSEDAQLELLAVVHRIMESFVDRAFGEDAAQLCRNSVDAAHDAHQAGDDAVIDLQPISHFSGTGRIAQAFNALDGCDRKERT